MEGNTKKNVKQQSEKQFENKRLIKINPKQKIFPQLTISKNIKQLKYKDATCNII